MNNLSSFTIKGLKCPCDISSKKMNVVDRRTFERQKCELQTTVMVPWALLADYLSLLPSVNSTAGRKTQSQLREENTVKYCVIVII